MRNPSLIIVNKLVRYLLDKKIEFEYINLNDVIFSNVKLYIGRKPGVTVLSEGPTHLFLDWEGNDILFKCEGWVSNEGATLFVNQIETMYDSFLITDYFVKLK